MLCCCAPYKRATFHIIYANDNVFKHSKCGVADAHTHMCPHFTEHTMKQKKTHTTNRNNVSHNFATMYTNLRAFTVFPAWLCANLVLFSLSLSLFARTLYMATHTHRTHSALKHRNFAWPSTFGASLPNLNYEPKMSVSFSMWLN